MVKHLTTAEFKELIFDYENEKEWKFKGSKPTILDFYADWCGPCKMVAPILDELSDEFDGKIDIYKINTEEESELTAIFSIRSIPSILFIPLNESPQMANGALPKDTFKKAIQEIFKLDNE